MGIKSFGNNAEDFVSKFLRARSFDSTGLDAANPEPPPPLAATGGTITSYDGKTIHIFTSTGTFTTNPNWTATNVEYLVVAGGGGGSKSSGGGTAGGGGGAGGYRTGTTTISGPYSQTITIGAGGSQEANGSPSTFLNPEAPITITSTGGGRGAKYFPPAVAGSGGSGGGGAWGVTGGGAGNTPPTSPPQGNPGGDGVSGGDQQGGGGGGAGGAGIPWSAGHHGGLGLQSPTTFRNPTSPVGAPGPNGQGFWFAGGGGGGTLGSQGSTGRGGGSGGPYAGGGNSGQGSGVESGLNNTGGGGGGIGASDGTNAGSGGSGIVLIAYPS